MGNLQVRGDRALTLSFFFESQNFARPPQNRLKSLFQPCRTGRGKTGQPAAHSSGRSPAGHRVTGTHLVILERMSAKRLFFKLNINNKYMIFKLIFQLQFFLLAKMLICYCIPNKSG